MVSCTSNGYLGRVIWITGLSGSGKSSLAIEIARHLRKTSSNVVCLDGDELRKLFSLETELSENYDRSARLALSIKYSQFCQLLSKQGLTVIIATISMFEEIYVWNRKNLPGYFEAYLEVPIEELRRRDSKSIYSRYFRGELKNVAGLDLPIDEPIHADWKLKFRREQTMDSLVADLLYALER